jgi:hypothetical protein
MMNFFSLIDYLPMKTKKMWVLTYAHDNETMILCEVNVSKVVDNTSNSNMALLNYHVSVTFVQYYWGLM